MRHCAQRSTRRCDFSMHDQTSECVRQPVYAVGSHVCGEAVRRRGGGAACGVFGRTVHECTHSHFECPCVSEHSVVSAGQGECTECKCSPSAQKNVCTQC
jgi:hypothetical protein